MALALHVLLQAAFIARILLRPQRDPASRLAWIVVVLGLPVLGMLGYLLLGETSIGRRRVARQRAVLAALPDPARAPGYGPALNPDIPARHLPLFRVGQSISGYAPVGGNRASLAADADATIAALVADIDGAEEHVHLLFYIWLPDGSGTRVADALRRAAPRRAASPAAPWWTPSARARAAGGQPAARRPDGAHRPARPPQGRRRRQPDRLLREPELRGPGVPG